MAAYQPYPKTHPGMWNYRPDDDEYSFYIADTAPLSEILLQAKEKWPDGWKDLIIDAEYIHTDCIYYDLYEPGDYTKFLKITRAI